MICSTFISHTRIFGYACHLPAVEEPGAQRLKTLDRHIQAQVELAALVSHRIRDVGLRNPISRCRPAQPHPIYTQRQLCRHTVTQNHGAATAAAAAAPDAAQAESERMEATRKVLSVLAGLWNHSGAMPGASC